MIQDFIFCWPTIVDQKCSWINALWSNFQLHKKWRPYNFPSFLLSLAFWLVNGYGLIAYSISFLLSFWPKCSLKEKEVVLNYWPRYSILASFMSSHYFWLLNLKGEELYEITLLPSSLLSWTFFLGCQMKNNMLNNYLN